MVTTEMERHIKSAKSIQKGFVSSITNVLNGSRKREVSNFYLAAINEVFVYFVLFFVLFWASPNPNPPYPPPKKPKNEIKQRVNDFLTQYNFEIDALPLDYTDRKPPKMPQIIENERILAEILDNLEIMVDFVNRTTGI